ncbi:2Fe-2S iron-sulfur cluster-binding protein [Sphingobium sp. SCG-1]|uniref:2Fe-2S iron-sulfur cluster-binding protein n=1 Tax=Sphingobium sp. SCG-1 TaxID=2072936 RepID=UPI001CB949CC|nr:2Fe-2S iron-sulfur cluster-binding protein [Sphingobium sp. SCG-1]
MKDGSQSEIEVEPGANVMRTAVDAGLPGIFAECGGACMCATCHVYVDQDSVQAFPPVGEVEEEMLECTVAERLPVSRLSCQLVVPEGVATVVVRVPDAQT